MITDVLWISDSGLLGEGEEEQNNPPVLRIKLTSMRFDALCLKKLESHKRKYVYIICMGLYVCIIYMNSYTIMYHAGWGQGTRR
jgi:hypothetical protein